MCVCVCVCVCICVCVCGVSVCLWMGGQRRDLIFSIFGWCRYLEGSLCLFWHEDHTKKELCLPKPARLEEG